MKRLLWIGLFLLGVWLAISQFSGLAGQGTFDTLLIDFGDDLTPAQVQAQLQALPTGIEAALNSEFSGPENLYVLKGDRQLLKTLRRSTLAKFTEHIEPNYLYSAALVPNDPDYSKQWNLRSINAEAAWDSATGKAVTVAVIDTGISPVPDLKGTRLVKGYDFVNDSPEAKDDNGHGTHVAGTIAQATNNRVGVAGVAFDAALMPLKVLSAGGGGTVADIAEAIRFAADNEAQVINMSLGGAGDSRVLKDAIDYAHSKGVFIVAAAGNANRNAAEYPARYPHVMAVAAIGPSEAKAPYSNYGAGVDIAAPGGATQPDSTAGGILQNTIDPRTGEPVYLALQALAWLLPM